MDNTKPESADISTPRTGPGRLLHQARLDLRLAPEDVAQILHLSSKQIIALETDDFQSLPAPTYVRGYLRGYAQLLGLAPEKVIEAYNSLTIPAKPILPPQSAPPQVTSSDNRIKAASLGVAAVVLGLVYLWWQSNDQSLEQTGELPAVTGQASVDVSPSPTIAADTSSSVAPAGLLATSGGEAVSPPGAGVTPAPNAVAPATVPAGQTTISGMTANVAPVEATKPASVAPAPADHVTTQRTRRAVDIPPGVPRARMVLQAVEESWADIRDARDNRLLYENVPAGRRISIEGVAPFSVFLGNADGVRVEFNGRNYDVSRHKRGQVARFTLGEAAANN